MLSATPTSGRGGLIGITGVAASASGRYVITQALHRFDATGYRTELRAAAQRARPRSDRRILGRPGHRHG